MEGLKPMPYTLEQTIILEKPKRKPSRCLQIRVDEEFYRQVRLAASNDRRSIATFVKIALENHLRSTSAHSTQE